MGKGTCFLNTIHYNEQTLSKVSRSIIEELLGLLESLLLDLKHLCFIYDLPYSLSGNLESDVYLLANIQQAMREKNENLPLWTYDDYFNLGYVAIAPFSTEKFILKCWPIVVDMLASIHRWVLFSREAALEIREHKKKMYIKYGIPPFVSSEQFRLLLREQGSKMSTTVNQVGFDFRNSFKPEIKIAVVGDNKSGKSTTIGSLTFKCVGMDKSTLEKFDRIQKMGSDYYANWNLETSEFYVDIIKTSSLCDMPCKPDGVLFIISAAAEEFETGRISKFPFDCISFPHHMNGTQLIVAVNKMDCTDPPFSEDRYEKIKMAMSKKLKRVGFNPEAVSFIPISGRYGDNVLETSENLSWFNGCAVKRTVGKTLIEAINEVKYSSSKNWKFSSKAKFGENCGDDCYQHKRTVSLF